MVTSRIWFTAAQKAELWERFLPASGPLQRQSAPAAIACEHPAASACRMGLAAADPLCRQRATHRIAELGPTSNAAETSWQEASVSTARTTRSRKSCE